LIDAMTPFGGGQLLPAGRLREPLTALARADIVVITRTESSPGIETTIRRYSSAPIFYAQPQLDSIRKIEAGRLAGPVSSGAADRLFVFCAIGNPNGFIQTLTQSGVTISGRKFFPDHHRFTRADADQILRAAEDVGSTGLICTEKDLYNLSGSFGDESNLFCATISLKIQHQDDFWHQIISKANDRAAASASKEDC
jgi:tetraacyldisaccharide 4'-kinase